MDGEGLTLFNDDYFLVFSIFNPASAASLVCLSSNVSNRSALIDKAEATCRLSNDLEPRLAECFFDNSMPCINIADQSN
jgi:hypothetical protein